MIQTGDIVRTPYGGKHRFVVVDVKHGCRCPEYLVQIDCDGTPCDHACECDDGCPLTRDDPMHIHFACVTEARYRNGRWRRSELYHFGGYVHETPTRLRCIWNDGRTPTGEPDVIEIVGHVAGSQLALALGG